MTIKFMGVAATAVTLIIGLAACSPPNLQAVVANPGCKPGPVVFIIPDVSGSTASQTVVNGPYEREMMSALKAAARACGDVYSAPTDGNSVGDSSWVIDGRSFRQTIGGNDALGAAAREKKVDDLLPLVRQELRPGRTAGTDILGSLQRIKIAIEGIHTNRPVEVIVLTDGALNLVGRYSMYTTPLDTLERRREFVARLAQLGELPDFGGKADVYIGGLGVGLWRQKARDIIATWQLLVPAMHAHLMSSDGTLRFP